MNIKLHNKTGRNMAVSALCKPISMVISYLYVPLVLNYLGIEKYGVWATILTILSWIGYFDVGIGNGLRNKLTEVMSKKDGQSKELVSSAYAFVSFIMIIASVVFSAVAMFINWNVVFGVDNVNESLMGIVILSVYFMALNFVLSICKNVLYAMQRAAVVSIMELATQLLNCGGIIVAMNVVESNLFVMAFVYGISMLLVNVIASILIYARYKELSPSFRCVRFSVGKSITSLGLQFFLIQICALVLFTTDSLIISYLYGAADVTPYNTVNKLFNVVIGVYAAMIAPIWSNVTKLKADGDYDAITKLLKRLVVIMIPFALGTVLLAIIFRPLTRLWLGVDLHYTLPLIVFGAVYCLLTIWCNTFASFSNGMQIMKASMIIACIQAVINIPLSLFLAEYFKLQSAGVLGGTCGAMLIAAIGLPIIVIREIKKNE